MVAALPVEQVSEVQRVQEWRSQTRVVSHIVYQRLAVLQALLEMHFAIVRWVVRHHSLSIFFDWLRNKWQVYLLSIASAPYISPVPTWVRNNWINFFSIDHSINRGHFLSISRRYVLRELFCCIKQGRNAYRLQVFGMEDYRLTKHQPTRKEWYNLDLVDT